MILKNSSDLICTFSVWTYVNTYWYCSYSCHFCVIDQTSACTHQSWKRKRISLCIRIKKKSISTLEMCCVTKIHVSAMYQFRLINSRHIMDIDERTNFLPNMMKTTPKEHYMFVKLSWNKLIKIEEVLMYIHTYIVCRKRNSIASK